MCPDCSRLAAACRCKKRSPAGPGSGPGGTPNDGIVRIARSTKGRRGKGVTLVTGVPLNAAELADLAKQLKNRCGAGGTVKDGVIEIQGDHRDRIVTELQPRGWTVKRSGG